MSAPALTAILPARSVSKIVTDIMQYEFGLDDSHCLLGNMPWKIPTDRQLFVVVFDDMGPPFGQATFLDTDPTSPTYLFEVQQSSVLHAIRVEIMSFIGDDGSEPAKEAAPRVAGALASFYSQQLQGQYRIQIGRAQSPLNATEAEETGRLLRYVVRANVTALHQVAKAPPGAGYDDKFNGATVPVDPDDRTSMPGPSLTAQE